MKRGERERGQPPLYPFPSPSLDIFSLRDIIEQAINKEILHSHSVRTHLPLSSRKGPPNYMYMEVNQGGKVVGMISAHMNLARLWNLRLLSKGSRSMKPTRS